MKQRRIDDVAVADHPADIGAAPPDLPRLDTVEIEHRPFQRDQMAAIVAHHAFGFAGGARRIKNVERIGRQHRHARRGFFCYDRGAAQFGPVVITAGDEIALLLRPLLDDAGIRLDAGEFYGFVEQRLVLHEAAGFEPATGREDQFRFGILDAGGELFCGKPAEHHRMHRADPRAGQHRDHRLRHHRHIENDAVALADAEILHDGGERPHLGQQLGIGEFGDGAEPSRIRQRRIVDQRHLVAAATRDVPVQRIVAGVDHGAGEPAAIEADRGVEDFFRRLDPVDLPCRLAPKAVGVDKRARVDFVVAAGVVDIHGVSPGTPLSRDARAIQVVSFRGARSASPESIATVFMFTPNAGTVVMDSGPAPRGASRNDG